MTLTSLQIIILSWSVLAVLIYIFGLYQVFRINVITSIRLKWIDIQDERIKRYTFKDMFNFKKCNWFGLKYPREKDYK